MAIWYTDNINGNDITGDGSIAAPYQRVTKAMQIGNNGDEIRVAGSGFTNLPGTCSHTQRGGTSWNTSQSLVGLLAPGDIITYNDPNFGNQKFFYKVFSVSATGFVTDGSTNFDENVNVTLSKLTQNHYFTTTTNVIFETITLSGKSQYDIRGGWVNNFTEQTGWTAMVYHSTSSATAISGTGFAAPSGAGLYVDRFMFVHSQTGLAGHTFNWSPGTLAFVYGTATTSTFGANPIAHPVYVNKDLYLSNARLGNFNNAQYAPDGSPALKYNNCWNMKLVQGTGMAPIEVVNYYVKSNNSSANQYLGNGTGLVLSSQSIVHNLTVSSILTAGSVEYLNINDAVSSVLIKNSLNKIGLNAAGLIFTFSRASTAPICMLNLPGQNIEIWAGDTITSGFAPVQATTSTTLANFFGYLQTIAYIKDSEGLKSVLGQGQIAYADSTQFSTGTNSFRLSKPKAVLNTTSLTPIDSFFIETATAKTITIRCKSSVAGNVIFALFNSLSTGNYNATASLTPPPANFAPQTLAVGTDWTDVVYTGLNAAAATLFLNTFQGLGVETASLPGKYIWIDSVTVA